MGTQATIKDILGEQGVLLAAKIFETDRSNFVTRVQTEIIEPRMAEINKFTGQENDSRYLAYVCEYAAMNSVRKKQ
jgi:hypothetical protein